MATRHFCDRCHQEMGGEDRYSLDLPEIPSRTGMDVYKHKTTVELCVNCARDVHVWFGPMTKTGMRNV